MRRRSQPWNRRGVLRSESEIESLRDAWARMQSNPNADLDFYLMVARSTPAIVRPYVLVVYRGEEPSALLVGRVEKMQMSASIGYLRLPGPRVQALTFIHGGLVGCPSQEDCELLAWQIRDSLRHGEADLAYFNHLRADSSLVRCLHQTPLPVRDFFPAFTSHRRFVLSGNSSEFRARLSPKALRNRRQEAQKLCRAFGGDVRVECLRQPSDLDRMVREIEQVAKKTYQRGMSVGFRGEPDEWARLQFKAERGWLRTYILYAAGKPCAFFSGTLYKGALFGDYMGYDPAYRQYSPGMYLVMQMIESLGKEKASEEIEAVDFGLGDARYKAQICNDEWQDATLYLFAPNLRGIFCNAYRTPVLFADRLARKLVGSGLQEKVKRLWRNLFMRVSRVRSAAMSGR